MNDEGVDDDVMHLTQHLTTDESDLMSNDEAMHEAK
jgi:hypothetical protein